MTAVKRRSRTPSRPCQPGFRPRRSLEQSAAPFAPSRSGRARESERVAEGRLAHALLQMLPEVARERRVAAAKAYLDAHGGALDATVCAALAALVVKTIEAPELAALFGPGSRGEVPLAGVLRRPGRAATPYRGRLDRVLVTQNSIVDRGVQARRGADAALSCARRPARRLLLSVTTALSQASPARRARLSRRSDSSVDRRRRARGGARCAPSIMKGAFLANRALGATVKDEKGRALMTSHFDGRVPPRWEAHQSGRAPKSPV